MQMSKAKKEVAVTTEAAIVPATNPNLVSVNTPGMEGAALEQSDFVIPRAKIVQALFKEATDGDIRPGTMVNTATSEILAKPEEVFRVQTLIVSTGQVYIPKDGNTLSCYSPDGITGIGDPGGSCFACPLSKWGKNNEPPLCMKTYNYLSRFLDADDPD